MVQKGPPRHRSRLVSPPLRRPPSRALCCGGSGPARRGNGRAVLRWGHAAWGDSPVRYLLQTPVGLLQLSGLPRSAVRGPVDRHPGTGLRLIDKRFALFPGSRGLLLYLLFYLM